MSVVYLATDSVLGNRVAIKEMKDHFLSPAERDMAASQFLQEAQILANLEHAGLPRVTNFFQDTNRHYLVMDYIRGETLEALANRNGGRLAEETVLRVASEVSRVLDYLHSSKPAVIFRDLKPSNIMLTDDGRVKLIDFGISKGFDAGGGTRTIIRGAGTPGFAPPEQYGTHGRSRTDARSDVYSLGATMYTLLTGEIPVEATDRWMHGIPLSAPRSLNPGVSSDTESLVLRMMELRPDDRPSTARAVLEEVRTYRPELTLPGDVTSVFPAAAMPAREPAPETPRPPTPGPATPEPAVPPRPVRRFRSSVSAAAEADASPAIDEDEPTRGMYPFVGSASSGARAAVAAVAAPPNGTLVAEAAPVASAQAVASAATQAPQETASAQAPVDASGPQAQAAPSGQQAPVDASGAQAQAAPSGPPAPVDASGGQAASSGPQAPVEASGAQAAPSGPPAPVEKSSQPPVVAGIPVVIPSGPATVLSGGRRKVETRHNPVTAIVATMLVVLGLVAVVAARPWSRPEPSPSAAATVASASASASQTQTATAASSAPAAIPSATATTASAAGLRLSISSTPSGADVYVDGGRVGSTGASPLIVNTSAEPHQIKLRKSGYLICVLRVEGKPGGEVPLAATLVKEAVVRIVPTPGKAKVTFDGAFRGSGEQTVSDLKPGTYSYKVFAEGYYSETGEVIVKEGQSRTVEVALAEIPPPQPQYTPPVYQEPQYYPAPRYEPRYDPPPQDPPAPRATNYDPPAAPQATPR